MRRDDEYPLDLVGLKPLMDLTDGSPDIVIGLIDGPVLIDHRDLATDHVREIGDTAGRGACSRSSSFACRHGTFVAGILSAKRGGAAPAICPGCTLLVRPIFSESGAATDLVPNAQPTALASAIVECVEAGARIVNLSVALTQLLSAGDERALQSALDYAASRGVITVAAAGNQAMVGSTLITRHPSVIPVVGCDRRGRPLDDANLGRSTARQGQCAPAEGISSLGAEGTSLAGGTSVAAPFVTGALALVWSEFPTADAGRLRLAIRLASSARAATVVPPLLNAWAIHEAMHGVRSWA
jgi:subtilisin family serine protease